MNGNVLLNHHIQTETELVALLCYTALHQAMWPNMADKAFSFPHTKRENIKAIKLFIIYIIARFLTLAASESDFDTEGAASSSRYIK